MAYATKSSSAHDLRKTVSKQQPAVQPIERPIEVTSKQSKKRQTAAVPYVKYVLIFACVFAVLLTIVSSTMKVTELTSQNDQLRSEITALQSEENALNAKKEQIYNLSYVEDYAKSVLGMVKLDKSEINYVEITNEERMVISQTNTEPSIVSGIARSFNAVLEYLN